MKKLLLSILILFIIPKILFCGPFDNVGPYDAIWFGVLIFSFFGFIGWVMCLIGITIHAFVKKRNVRQFLITCLKFSAGYIVIFYALVISISYLTAYQTDSPRRESMKAIRIITHQYTSQDCYATDSYYYQTKSAHYSTVVFFHNGIDSLTLKKIKDLGNVHIDSMKNRENDEYWR